MKAYKKYIHIGRFISLQNKMKKIIIIWLFTITTLLLTWCWQQNQIENWDKVTIIYTGTLQDTTIFDTGTKTITIWSNEILLWIEKAIINKKEKDKIKTTISPNEWYGNKYIIYNKKEIPENILDRLWLSKEIWSKISLDKIQWIIVESKKSEDNNWIIILETNPEQTRKDTNYEIYIEKVEKSATTYSL